MAIQDFAYWLEATPISIGIQSQALLIPLVQSVHIFAVAVVFAGSVVVTARALGLAGGAWPLRQWAGTVLTPLWWALGVLLVSGTVLVIGEPTRELMNPAFRIKLLLVVLAFALARWLAGAFLRADENAVPPPAVRALGVVLVLLWAAIVFAGRWIAYV